MLTKLLRAAAITAVLSVLMQAGAFAPSQPRLTANQQVSQSMPSRPSLK